MFNKFDYELLGFSEEAMLLAKNSDNDEESEIDNSFFENQDNAGGHIL